MVGGGSVPDMTDRSGTRTMNHDRHVLHDTYGPGEIYGLPPGSLPGTFYDKLAKSILVVAAGDGRLTASERDYLVGLTKALGAPREVIESVRAFDPSRATLEDSFDKDLRPLAKIVLYDAVRTARVDGFAQKERELARRGAKLLGLDIGIVPSIEAMLAVEDAVRAARLSVIQAPERWTGPGPTTAELGDDNDWWRTEQHGVRGAIPAIGMVKVGKAILKIASGDGQLTDAETNWYYGMAKALGAPPPAIEEVMKWDPRATPLEDLIDASTRPFARMVLYDAVRCAASDGFAEGERRLAVKAAKLLDLDPGLVPWVEGVIELEHAARRARMKLLSPS